MFQLTYVQLRGMSVMNDSVPLRASCDRLNQALTKIHQKIFSAQGYAPEMISRARDAGVLKP